EVRRLLDVLLDASLLERRGIEGGRPGAFVLALTEEGAAVMRADHRPPLALPVKESPASRTGLREPRGGRGPAATRGAAASGPPDAELLGRLKSWRAAEAKRRGVPAYVIFHDSTLEALAVVRPRDHGALLTVRGVGPVKMKEYAEDLLKMLAEPA